MRKPPDHRVPRNPFAAAATAPLVELDDAASDHRAVGLAAAAAKLQKGGITGPIKPLSGDGYYFVRLLETNNQEEINYQLIKVPLKEFKQQIETLKQSGKVTYYIAVPDAKPQIQTK